jgi:HIV Tat-specific factor 1
MDDISTLKPRIKLYERKLVTDSSHSTETHTGNSNDSLREPLIPSDQESGKSKTETVVLSNKETAVSTASEANTACENEPELTGEALIVYLREESAQLAVNILDESYFRPSHMIRVSLAERKPPTEGDADTLKESDTKKSTDAKKAWKDHMQRMSRRLEWTTNDNVDAEEEVERVAQQKLRDRYQKVAIICNLEDPEKLETMDFPERRTFLIELKEDLLEECDQFGTVVSVTILVRSREEGGCTAAVRFKNANSASVCVSRMNGRFFAERRLSSWIHDGSFSATEEDPSLEIDEKQRIQEFGQWLESQ